MGVYINMEMPNNCRDCPLEDAYEGYNCRIVEKSANWGLEGRPSWCPLVPVSPHGDLIDRDALEQDAQKRLLICDKNDNQFQRPYEVMRAIALAPTIIPASKEGET